MAGQGAELGISSIESDVGKALHECGGCLLPGGINMRTERALDRNQTKLVDSLIRYGWLHVLECGGSALLPRQRQRLPCGDNG